METKNVEIVNMEKLIPNAIIIAVRDKLNSVLNKSQTYTNEIIISNGIVNGSNNIFIKQIISEVEIVNIKK